MKKETKIIDHLNKLVLGTKGKRRKESLKDFWICSEQIKESQKDKRDVRERHEEIINVGFPSV